MTKSLIPEQQQINDAILDAIAAEYAGRPKALATDANVDLRTAKGWLDRKAIPNTATMINLARQNARLRQAIFVDLVAERRAARIEQGLSVRGHISNGDVD